MAREEKRVECLGITFKSDEARRAYFLEKLKDPEFRKIEGFPIGEVRTYPPSHPSCTPQVTQQVTQQVVALTEIV